MLPSTIYNTWWFGSHPPGSERGWRNTANLPTNILDFIGFDSSIILIIRGGIPKPIGDFPNSLSQAMLVGIMLVGRLGVQYAIGTKL